MLNGYFSPNNNLIVIDEDQSFDMKFRVLIHEYAHYKLEHGSNALGLDRGQKELQAESCAYIVSDYYNLDTSDYSVGYSAAWGKDDRDTIIQFLSDIKGFASDTIEEINTMPNFEKVITQEQMESLSKEEENSLTKMIDTNLKNGFDKIAIIKGNLETDFKMTSQENTYENKYFKVDIDYKGYDTKNIKDNCNIVVTNKINEEEYKYNYQQTYQLNNLNNTSQITVTDLNNDKNYIHNRDYEGNVISDGFKTLSDEDQLVSFEKYIEKNVEEKGILATQKDLIADTYRMGFKLQNEDDLDSQEFKLTFLKNDDIGNKNPFRNQKEKIQITVLQDNNKNHHANFKMENSKGIINKDFVESNEKFIENGNKQIEKLKEKKEQMEI